jgi:hypothetical protein
MIGTLAAMFGACVAPVATMVLGGYWATRSSRPDRRA